VPIRKGRSLPPAETISVTRTPETVPVLRERVEPGLRPVPIERSAIITYRVQADRVMNTDAFDGGRDFEALHRSDRPDDDPAP
jgi:hypothetical protein